MYINLWYVAAFSSELTDRPLRQRMLSRDFVLYRTSGGAVACLSNVCPHRGASLAQGVCHSDGTISCPQHGWRFSVEGQCQLIPSQLPPTRVPAGIQVDAYPVHEQHGLIWVFLGSDPQSAPPLPAMPEIDLPGWRTMPYGEVWNCNYHWAKFSNLDLTHVPIVHGQKFIGAFTPPEEITRIDSFSVSSRVVTPFEQPKGNWQTVREQGRKLVSTITFHLNGFMSKGHVEIGGEGSGVFVTFFEFATPIDAENTHMRFLFVRNFMAEPEHDEGYLARNLKNVREDRLVAEAQLPKYGPTLPSDHDILLDPDDSLVRCYWDILRRQRQTGCEIDQVALRELDRGHRYTVIPSPARRVGSATWAHGAVPVVS